MWSGRKKAIAGGGALLAVLALTSLLSFRPSRVSLPAYPSHYHLNLSAIPDELPESLLDRLSLTQEQCNALFPDNDLAARRTADWYRKQGGVTRAMADDAADAANARIVIKDGVLHIDRYRYGYQSRVMAVIQSLYAAVLTAPEPLPDLEFSFAVGDWGSNKLASWELAFHESAEPSTWLLLDFGFFGWPEAQMGSYNTYRDQVQSKVQAIPWVKKINKLFWRGNPMVENRRQLLEMTANQPWADVAEIDWWNPEKGPIVSLPDFCEHKFLAGTEGNTYSGRLKFLLHCRSVIVSHRREWLQHFHHLLDWDAASESQNIVYPAGPGWEGLDATMAYLMDNDERAEQIADNAYRVFARRYLSPAAGACYWRSALGAYADVQAFTPEIRDAQPYDEFILTHNPHD